MAGTQAHYSERPEFLFATCQVGAEKALKSEMARLWPDFSFAYSRPGFLTFKLPEGHNLPDDFDPRSVFARTHGFTLGKSTAEGVEARAQGVWQLAGQRSFEALHVWQRDTAVAGFRGFEPQITPLAHEAEAAIQAARPGDSDTLAQLAGEAGVGQLVLDCILVEPNQWWVGYHRAIAGESRYAGGLTEITVPHDTISRAYLKMEEALAWSGLPIKAGEQFVELGCAPGGASQALLAHGLVVIGIDPAQVDARLLGKKRFTHIQKRGADVRRREFRGATWLAADMNVAPQYTLDTVESIVTNEAVNIRGLLLTLKLPEWELAEQIPVFLDRIRSWGYAHVRARQLAHNRQEFCVTALRRKPSPGRVKLPGEKRVPPRPPY